MRLVAVGSLVLVLPLLGGCRTLPESPPEIPAAAASGDHTLTLIVAELRMHLRDDTYRTNLHKTRDGQDVFEVALWRLERLQRRRSVPEAEWGNVDLVIEYARGRTLERLRRYAEAAAAYARVAENGSSLAASAGEAREVMLRFAEAAAPPAGPRGAPDDRIRFLEERLKTWEALAWEYRNTPYEPLALEEAEAWAMLRVEALARHRDAEAALEACHRLIERHRASKLYAKHLIRLGDLYADAAHREYLRYRAHQASFEAARYDGNLDRAFAAYELAREQRKPALRAEAQKKIEALLAVHQGVRDHVP